MTDKEILIITEEIVLNTKEDFAHVYAELKEYNRLQSKRGLSKTAASKEFAEMAKKRWIFFKDFSQ